MLRIYSALALLAGLIASFSAQASPNQVSVIIDGANYSCTPCQPGQLGCGQLGANPGALTLTIACAGNAEVQIESINLNTGDVKHLSIPTGNWSNCANYATALQTRFGSSVTQPRIGAVCGDNATLQKILVSPVLGEAKIASSVSTGNWSTCTTQADAINAGP